MYILKLMEQGGTLTASGFTIVETLIVLAVTGILFASAAIAINGRQNKTEFATSINNAQQAIQEIINQVSTFVPNSKTFNCTSTGIGHPTIAVGANGEGTNYGCVFLGKVLQFSPDAAGNGNYNTFTIAGNQRDASGNEVTKLIDAAPIAVAPTTADGTLPNITTSATFEYGLNAGWIKYKLPGNTGSAYDGNSASVGFITSFGSYSGTYLNSGSQQLSMYIINGSNPGDSAAVTADTIDKVVGVSNNFVAVSEVDVCLNSGTTPQHGTIVIGGGQKQLSVSLVIGNGACA